MAKNEFIGWTVRVSTKNGAVIEGVVSDLDDAEGRLSLSDAQVTIGRKSRSVELVSVQGDDIADLQVISQGQQLAKERKAESHLPRSSSEANTTASTNSAKNPWVNDSARELKKTDFDFQASLQMFDKKKTFEEMKGSLKPEELLATHNSSNRPKTSPIQPSASLPDISSVTKPIPKEKLFALDQLEGKPKKKIDPQPQSVRILQKPKKSEESIEERREDLARLRISESAVAASLSIVGSVKKSIRVPLLNEESAQLVEQKASKLTGPTTDQQLECASREILRVLLQDELVGIPGSAVVLVGNHREGAVALAVGRSLVNRGAAVTAVLLTTAGTLLSNDHVAFQKKLFLSAGGKCEDLVSGAFDLIIDGAGGKEAANEEVRDLLSNINYSFAAAIERPTVPDCNCSFALAFPKTGLHRSPACPLYLVDINLPTSAYKNVVPDFNAAEIFGTRLSVRLR